MKTTATVLGLAGLLAASTLHAGPRRGGTTARPGSLRTEAKSVEAYPDSISNENTPRRQVSLSGTVTDAKTGEPLAGAVITTPDKGRALAVTDADGHFTLTAGEGIRLEVALLGYATRPLTVRQAHGVSISLEEDKFKIDEVVVTGQGSEIQKRRLSSSVTTVQAADLAKVKLGRVDQVLQDLLPNVQVALSSGSAGSTSRFQSRGLSSAFVNSTPVIYVDGVRVDNNNTSGTLINDAFPDLTGNMAANGSLSDIPMEGIDHIEYVPGGAATTLYGSDAANGVIQIFTRKGGVHPTRFYAGADLEMDSYNSQWYHWKRTKELLNQTGWGQRYRFGFDGGTERFGYSFSGSMYDNTGTLTANGNKERKYDMRFGSRVKFNRVLQYQNSFGTTIYDYRRHRNGNQGYYTGYWFTEGSACAFFKYTDAEGNTQYFNPDIDAQDDYQFSQMKSFVKTAEQLQDNKWNVKRFQTSQQLLATPLEGLTLKALLGIDYRVENNKNIETNAYLIHTQKKPAGTTDAGSINNYDRKYYGITVDLNAQYKLRYDEWLSSVSTAGFQYFSTSDHQSTYNGSDVRDGSKIITGAGELTASEWKSYLYNYGFYAQENLGLLDRYYLDLGLRTDYNTAFGDNVGWQLYPKVGLSYVMTEEPFMRGLRESGMVNSLRLLANYGVAGNYPPAFEYERTVTFSSYLKGQAATFGKYGNPDLAPEKKHSVETGLQAVLFHRALHLGFTYYYSRTKDALFWVPALPSSGQTATYPANVGDIQNSGVELSLGWQVINSRNWQLRLNASWNTNHNRVLSIGNAVPFAIGGFGSSTIQTVVDKGKSIGFLRGNKAVLNDDGTLREVLQQQDLGKTLPTGYGSFGISAAWKQLEFTLTGDYQYGGHVHEFDRQFRFARGIQDDAVPQAALGGASQSSQWINFTNFFVEKSDFVKIRNIGVDYTLNPAHLFPRHAARRSTAGAASSFGSTTGAAGSGSFIKEVRLGFHVYNPLAWTKAEVDPEASLAGGKSQGAAVTGGINYSTFSAPRQFVFSLSVTF